MITKPSGLLMTNKRNNSVLLYRPVLLVCVCVYAKLTFFLTPVRRAWLFFRILQLMLYSIWLDFKLQMNSFIQ